MGVINRFMSFLNNEHFVDNHSVLTLYDYHPQIHTILAINGLFFNHRHSKFRFVWPIFCITMSVICIFIEITVMIQSLAVDDMGMMTQSFAYVVVIGVMPFHFTSMFLGSDGIYNAVSELDADFRFITSLGEPFRSAFLKANVTIRKCCISWLSFIAMAAYVYLSFSLVTMIYYALFETYTEDSKRPFIFPTSFPVGDPYATPLYEILMFISYTAIFVFATTFPSYVYVVFHFWLHSYYLLDLSILGINSIFDGLDENVARLDHSDPRWIATRLILNRRFKLIVDWHNQAFKLLSCTIQIFGLSLAYQIVFSATLICIMIFDVVLELERGSIDPCLLFLSLGALIQLWIPCYIGSILREKGFSIGDTCYSIGWYKTPLSVMVQKDLALIILRSQKPITLQVTCLPILQMETFSSIVSSSYSYFNMLKQT